jgi:hypothetical protein
MAAGKNVPQPHAIPAGKYVDAGRARTSPLIWQLVGADVSRPWDRNSPRVGARHGEVQVMPPPGKGTPLNEEELKTVIQWIDLGAQYEAVEPAETETNRVTLSQ